MCASFLSLSKNQTSYSKIVAYRSSNPFPANQDRRVAIDDKDGDDDDEDDNDNGAIASSSLMANALGYKNGYLP